MEKVFTNYKGEGVFGYSKNGYTPYRPKPVELDSRPKTAGNVWSAESYNKINNVEKLVDGVKKESSKPANFYSNPKLTESTLLGEVDKYSDTRSVKIRKESYRKGLFDGVQCVYKTHKPSRTEKFIGILLEKVI